MQAAGNIILAGPDGSFGSVVARNSNWPDRMCVIKVVHTVLRTVQRPGMSSVVYVKKHYKEPLKSFDKSRVWSRPRASFYRDSAMIVQKAT